MAYLCVSERGGAQALPLFAFLGKLSYMSAKTILYDRKNYKQASKNLLLDSFCEVLYNCSEVLFCKKFLKERFDFVKANFPFLNYP